MFTTKKQKKRPEPRRLTREEIDKAMPVAERYRITLWRQDGEWYGQGVEEPGAMADGKTIAQCVRNVRQALAAVVASNMIHGEPVVEPIIDRERKGGRKAG